MLNIAVCDDDVSERAVTRALLEDYLSARRLAARVREFAAGRELLFAVEDAPFDVYLLDVVMPELDGIALGRALRETDRDGAIIYLTTSRDHAIESYSARALYYLVKPVTAEALYPVLDLAAETLRRRERAIFHVRTRGGTVQLQLDEVYYAELANRAVCYVCRDRVVESVALEGAFREAVAPLLADGRFALCGASLALNLQHVRSVGRDGAALRSGQRVAVPRRAVAALRDAWTEYWLEGGGAR